MTQFGPFMVLIGVLAVLLAALGGVAAWYNQESRRIRRGLSRVLRAEPHALVVAQGQGRGAGFNFTSNIMAVAWDAGEWCLIYRLEELLGVELIVDAQVAGRAFRGEPRRAVDVLGGAEKQVSLRLIFDDPRHADFTLELWSAARRRGPDPAESIEEGNRWLARIESVFRRQPSALAGRAPRRPEPAPAAAAPPRPAPEAEDEEDEPAAAAPAPPPRPARPPAGDGRQELPFDEDPPWDEDDQQALL